MSFLMNLLMTSQIFYGKGIGRGKKGEGENIYNEGEVLSYGWECGGDGGGIEERRMDGWVDG